VNLLANLKKQGYTLAFDAISTPSTVKWMANSLSSLKSSKLSVLAGGVLEDVSVGMAHTTPSNVQVVVTNSGATSQLPNSKYADLVHRWLNLAGSLVIQGKVQTQPYTILPNGLLSVPMGLKMLRDGTANSRKLICESKSRTRLPRC
jgi:hypothetical protein